MDARELYTLEDLCLLSQVPDKVRLCLAGEPVVRDWRCGRSFPSLDEALAGGVKSWALSSYGICDKGLMLDFLPRTEQRLMSEANSASAKLTDLCQEEYWKAASEHTAWLYQKYNYRVLVVGRFQAWFRHQKNGRGDIVYSNGKGVTMMVIENRRKSEKAVYSLGGGDQMCREMYA